MGEIRDHQTKILDIIGAGLSVVLYGLLTIVSSGHVDNLLFGLHWLGFG